MVNGQEDLQLPSFETITEMIEHPPLEPPTFSVKEALEAAIAKFTEEHSLLPFSGRHPEYGKMINCPVCKTRHRAYIKCVQKFTVDYIEEDLETGEKTEVLRVAKPRHAGGSQSIKGKRLKPHLSKPKLQFIEKVRKLVKFDDDTDLESDGFKKLLLVARKKAARLLRKEQRAEADKKRDQRELSRSINRANA